METEKTISNLPGGVGARLSNKRHGGIEGTRSKVTGSARLLAGRGKRKHVLKTLRTTNVGGKKHLFEGRGKLVSSLGG